MGLFGPPNIDKLKAKKDVQGLIKALDYQKDWKVQRDAAQALGEIGDFQGTDALLVALNDRDLAVRCAAARALGKIGNQRAVPALISALDDWQHDLQTAASDALVLLGLVAIYPLIKVLNQNKPDTRILAIKTLGAIPDGRSVRPLIDCLQDQSSSVCQSAQQALVNLGSLSIEPLIRLLKDPHNDLQKAAAEILERLNWQPTHDQDGAHFFIVTKQWHQCVLLGEAAIQPLIENLNNKDPNTRNAAIDSLIKIGPPAEEPLIAALKSDNHLVRQSAVVVLESISGERSFAPLLEVLQDKADDVHLAAAKALAKIGGEQIIEPFIPLLESPNQALREVAAKALVELAPASVAPLIVAFGDGSESQKLAIAGIFQTLKLTPLEGENGLKYLILTGQWDQCVPMGKDAVDVLITELKNQDAAHRTAAANTLVKIGTPALEPLIDALQDQDEHVRSAAASALAQLGGEAAQEALLATLKDDSKTVRLTAALGLKNLGWKPGEDQFALEYHIIREQWTTAQHFGSRGAERLIDVLDTLPVNAHQPVLEALIAIGPDAVKPLINALKHNNKEIQGMAIVTLGIIGDDRAVTRLIDVLKYGISTQRQLAAEALGQIGNSRAISPLLAALKDMDHNGRKAAIGALSRLGDPAIAPLITALGDKDKGARQGAATVLGLLGEVNSVEPLIAALKDKDRHVRQSAAIALGQLRDGRAIEPLGEALNDNVEQVREAAAEALASIDPVGFSLLVDLLKHGNPHIRHYAVTHLGNLRQEKAIIPLIGVLSDNSAIVSQAAIKALASFGKAAVQPLIAAIRENQTLYVHAAVNTLVKIGPSAGEDLRAALFDENELVREAAADVLKKLKWKPSKSQIGAQFLIATKQWDQCAKMSEQAVQPLIMALQNQDSFTRLNAAIVLGKIGSQDAIQPLVAALQDPSASVRQQASTALAKIGSRRAIEPLILMLKDKNQDVRTTAADGLDLLGWKPEQGADGAAYWIAKRQWEPCAQIGAPAVEPLITALKFDESWVRNAAVSALGKLGDVRATQPLIDALADEDKVVRNAAIEGLVDLGTPAVKPLLTLLQKNNVQRQAAAKVLVRLYQSGKLNAANQQLILKNRSEIIKKSHTDRDLFRGGSDCHSERYGHEDTVLRFPV